MSDKNRLISVEIDEGTVPPRSVVVDLSAIMTEAFRNALGHADASEIRIEGKIGRDRGWFSVSDDGRGIAHTSLPTGHFGIVGMKERADRIGAQLSIEETPGGGTTIRVRWGIP